MLPEERDAAHLWDMRQAARDALALARDVTFEELNVVWDVVSHDLPGLVEALEALVPPDDPV